ncbi:MAG: hypothetical protein E7179_06420 [Erysipelotrichaceae bacterium]|jgi:hypothetical protein|nr:hypothetical protein [Erysipelotrichaceae bacterium]
MKKLLLIAPLLLTVLPGCGETPVLEDVKWEEKTVNFYQANRKDEAGKLIPSRQINLRFYEENPNVPYIGVKRFFQEFYKTEVTLKQQNQYFDFEWKEGGSIQLDAYKDIFTVQDLERISAHPDFISESTKVYVELLEEKQTTPAPKTIDLKNYHIPAYGGNGDAYLPLTMIASIATGSNMLCITYNEKDLYEFDYSGELSQGVRRDEAYYGSQFHEAARSDTKRKEDLAEFSYNLLCLDIDNFRGFTTQMAFIDNNVLSLGLDGTIQKLYPELKKWLLSLDRIEYQAGMIGLFCGLSDGGHTSLNLLGETLNGEDPWIEHLNQAISNNQTVRKLRRNLVLSMLNKEVLQGQIDGLKKSAFGEIGENYYYKDEASKTSYIGFDSFRADFLGWDAYYKDLDQSKIPTEDSFAHVREKLYQALQDGAKNVVIDLSTNGGGNSLALTAIVGLLNQARSTFTMNNVSEKTCTSKIYKVDINLDGKFDDADVKEADKFKAMTIVVLTSPCAFSCGNLLPSLLKEIGYQTIGQKTGGGSCSIMFGASADGLTYFRSSYSCLSDSSGHNIDSGVEPDIEIEPERFFDAAYVAEALAKAARASTVSE